MKGTTYTKNPQMLELLEKFNCEAWASVSVQTLQRVTSNFTSSLHNIIAKKIDHIKIDVM